jgi:exodeoxyribonuclease VII small subunit
MDDMTLEQGLEKLEELTSRMESGELTLEEMYSLYKEGIDIVKECGKKIDTVEKNMIMINSEGECSEFQ